MNGTVMSAEGRSRMFWTWFASKHPARGRGEPLPVGQSDETRADSDSAAAGDPIPKRAKPKPLEGIRQARGYAITGSGRRKAPPASIRARVLDVQRNRCMYCEHEFGTIVRRGTRTLSLRLNWDHFIPYSFGLTNAGDNWIAACHVCNGIKSSRMFETVGRAKQFILARWVEKGYDLIPVLTLGEIYRQRRRVS